MKTPVILVAALLAAALSAGAAAQTGQSSRGQQWINYQKQLLARNPTKPITDFCTAKLGAPSQANANTWAACRVTRWFLYDLQNGVSAAKGMWPPLTDPQVYTQDGKNGDDERGTLFDAMPVPGS